MNITEDFLKEQILRRMRIDNPWWLDNAIPADVDAMKRRLYMDLFYPLVADLSVRRAIVLFGPRRVGKTIMLFHTIGRLIAEGVSPQRIIYLSVDTPIYNNLSLERLFDLACESLGRDVLDGTYYVIYDEVQYLRDWEKELKSMVDTYRTVRFIASGSAAAALKMQSQESGAGRFTDFMLPPLTFVEFLHLQGLEHLIVPKVFEWRGETKEGVGAVDQTELNRLFLEYINYGGYPEIVFSPTARANPSQFVRHDIVDKVMLRDLPALYGISDTQNLYRLFVHIAFRSGGEFSYDDLSKESGIRKETLRRYVSYLEAAFLIKVVHRIDINARRMQRETTFKIYLTNPSLRCAIFSPLTEGDPMMGNMVETAVFAQWVQRDNTDLYYANWKEGRRKGEVDMVSLDQLTQKPNWAVEIKWSDRYYEQTGELQSLLDFMQNNGIMAAIVTSVSVYARKVLPSVELLFFPSALYAYLVGRNTLRQRAFASLGI